MTSLLRELVSVPTVPCFSIRTVDAPSLDWSLRAIASPTTPPPITACVKSTSLFVVDEKDLAWIFRGTDRNKARDVNMMVDRNNARKGRLADGFNNERLINRITGNIQHSS